MKPVPPAPATGSLCGSLRERAVDRQGDATTTAFPLTPGQHAGTSEARGNRGDDEVGTRGDGSASWSGSVGMKRGSPERARGLSTARLDPQRMLQVQEPVGCLEKRTDRFDTRETR